MATQEEKARDFLAAHRPGEPLLLPNPWDRGSTIILASLGYQALATTSSGCAAALGRLDGQVTRDEALEHAADIVEATDLPVSADLENGFADDPAGVADTVTKAAATGLAGCSIEDYTRDDARPIYDAALAVERVKAAAEAAHVAGIVLTARCENHLHGQHDLDDTIARLRGYAEAGADVLYAPGLTLMEDIKRVVDETQKPVNVLAMPGTPAVGELAAAGVARISTGGALAYAAYGALTESAAELLHGSYTYLALSAVGRKSIVIAASR